MPIVHIEAQVEVSQEVYDKLNASPIAFLGMRELEPIVSGFWKLGSLSSATYETYEQWSRREGAWPDLRA